jgi:hypothetical protein
MSDESTNISNVFKCLPQASSQQMMFIINIEGLLNVAANNDGIS